jgi:malyl-CoA/(S)-citramalyl-CoA lyase
MLVTQIETAKGFKNRIGFELIIETALGMQNVNEIAGASKRIESLHFGVADYAASTRARTTNIGGANPDYAILTDKDEQGRRETHWGDMWHYALARMVVAARASGIRPIDGPFGDFSDAEGYKAAGRRAAVLGCEGKWAIHPSQVALANETFTPSAKEVERARRILAAMEQATREGRGAVALDGRLIDIASIRQAEVLVKKAAAIGAG